MKRKLLGVLVVVFVFVAGRCEAQPWRGDTINFESANNSIIKIDTSQHSNIWQIGVPHKVIFDSAFTRPNAIVTDTVGYYPINNTSSFQFTIYDSAWINSGFHSWQNCQAAPFISFTHKYDTDSLKDGGYIKYSIDSGLTWTSIDTFYTGFYGGFSDTIIGGIHAFTGNSNGWQDVSLGLCCWAFPMSSNSPPSIIFRFTFKSDSINTNKEGWIIDNLYYGSYVCEGIKEYNKSNIVSVFPVPASATISFQSEEKIRKGRLFIYNDEGKTVKTIDNINGTNWEMAKGDLANGIYFYRLFDGDLFSGSGKFVFE